MPHPFIATKTITHSLPRGGSFAPQGWSTEFPEMVSHVVLNGFSVFAKADALAVGRKMLARGPVRIKLATGIAGLGQFVVESQDACREACISARSLTYRLIEGADHGLSDDVSRNAYSQLLTNWFAELVFGKRPAEQPAAAMPAIHGVKEASASEA